MKYGKRNGIPTGWLAGGWCWEGRVSHLGGRVDLLYPTKEKHTIYYHI